MPSKEKIMDAACNVKQMGEKECKIKSKLKTDFNHQVDSEPLSTDISVNSSITCAQDDLKKVPTEGQGPENSYGRKKDAVSTSVISGREVAIQANDFEIERGSSHLPQRRRFVPLRFSDFRVFASNVKADEEEEEEEEKDCSFRPTSSTSKSSSAKPSKPKRGRGRPRKYTDESRPEASPSKRGDSEDVPVQSDIVKTSNGFKCNICQRVFSLRGNAKAHLLTHSDEKSFPCDFAGCDKKLRTKESLRRHKLSHMGIKMFECNECKRKFSCNLSLQEHMSLHTGEKPLSCEVCGRKFRQVAVLKRHLTTHSNSKPYACGVCGRRFALKVYVHSHMKTHTGERPFSCDECSKTFAHASDLNRHKIIHSGKKPYECSFCSMRYSDPSSRRRHEREHQNKEEYICHICNQRFPRAGQLRVHILKEHSSQHTTVPYTVEVGVKPATPKPWADIEMNIKGSGTTQTISSNVVAMSVTEAEGSVQEEDSFLSTVHSQPMQLVLDGESVNQVDCILRERIVIQDNVPDVDKACGQTLIMEVPKTGQELLDLQQQNCTYRIVNSDEKNQVYELHFEGSQLPYSEANSALTINITDLKMKENTVALIQDEGSLTVINQPESEGIGKISGNVISVKSGDVIPNPKESQENCETEIIKEEILQQEYDTIVAILKDDVQVPVHDLPKTSEMNVNTEILIEHSEEAIGLNNESLSVVEMKSGTTDDKDINVTMSSFSAILDSPFISNPDLNSQEYYNWLAAFSEMCKRLALPLGKEVFLKISQVQKTLSDYMAIPSGVISDKNNFKVLMNITQDFSSITSSHLSFMYTNLSH